MAQAIVVRSDYAADEVRQFARRAKDAAQARRLLAIAAVLDGASRTGAAFPGSAHPIHLCVWCSMSSPWSRRRSGPSFLQQRSHAVASRRNCRSGQPRCPRNSASLIKPAGMARKTSRCQQHLTVTAAAACTRTQCPRKYLAVHAAELAIKSDLQLIQ